MNKRKLRERSPEARKRQTLATESEDLMVSEVSTNSSAVSSLTGSPHSSYGSSNGSSAGSSRSSSRSSSTSRVKKFVCKFLECDKAYSKPSLLEQHRRSHDNIRPFQCDSCSKAFFRRSHLDAHVLSHKTAEEKPFKCNICGKGVNTKQHLRRHEITHLKSFKCPFDLCDQSFYKNNQLKNHILSVHENKLTCKDCGKVYNRPYRLANHREKAHGSVPQYQCSYATCVLIFKTWSALQLHIKTDHPKLKCTVCGKPCVGESGLRMHMIIHDQSRIIRIWNCKACPRTFAKKADLLIHYGGSHPDIILPKNFEEQEADVAALTAENNEDETEEESSDEGSIGGNLEGLLKKQSILQVIAFHGNKEDKPIVCSNGCGRNFKRDYDLQRHLKCCNRPARTNESSSIYTGQEPTVDEGNK